VTDLFTDHLQKQFPKIDAIVGKCYGSCSIFISASVMCLCAVKVCKTKKYNKMYEAYLEWDLGGNLTYFIAKKYK